MTEVPRRMPPTPTGRAKNVATTHAALSGQGQTKAARPVTDNARQTRIYQPPKDQAVITGSSGGVDSTSISSTLPGPGGSDASGDGSVAVGTDSAGSGAFAGGTDSTAVGGGAAATHDYGGAIGAETFAGGLGTWAIGTDSTGTGAAESAQDVIRLGTSLHTTVVIGALVISDGSNKWRLDATGGTLTLVAYP